MVLETTRLILRDYTLEDFEALFEILSDAETMQHYPKPYDEEMTKHWIEWNIQNYQKFGFGIWAVILKETGEFIGDCGMTIQNIDGELLFLDVISLTRKFRFSMRNDELTITLDTIGLDKHFIYYLIAVEFYLQHHLQIKEWNYSADNFSETCVLLCPIENTKCDDGFVCDKKNPDAMINDIFIYYNYIHKNESSIQ